jgi:CHAD domain-containing protein
MEERVERRVFLDVSAGFFTLEPFGEPVDERVFTTTVFDAPDRVLASAGLGLNRRLENGKSVWQLELPAQRGTRTLTVLGGPARPPRPLRDLLIGVLRERRLDRIATIRTKRSTLRVRRNGHDVATVARDEIAVMDGQRVDRELTQLHVSLGMDEDRASRRLFKRLRKAGAKKQPKSPSTVPVPEDSSPLEHTRAMLATQFREILRRDPGTRLGADPEDLHRMRVATRRARAILRAGRPLLEPEWSDSLRAELGWLGSSLGAVRDLDVLIFHLKMEAETLGEEEAFAANRIVHDLEREREKARGALLEDLESERYSQLLDRLEQAALAPPGKDADLQLPALAAAEFESLRKVASKLAATSTDEDLHRARVKAKRARYAAELAEPLAGATATRFIDCAKRFQDVVGDHQDAVVAEERIRAVAGSARARKVAFAAGRLVERERERRAAAREKLPEAWAKLERSGRRAWS